jgi:S1-C subfamily serine protease
MHPAVADRSTFPRWSVGTRRIIGICEIPYTKAVRCFLRLAPIMIILLHLSSGAFAMTADELNTISIYESVSASVVNITTTVVEYDFFFRPLPAAGSGSGIILKDDGIIVTNHHVVANARRIQVTLADGSNWQATVMGSAPHNDLAVIRINPQGHPLQAIALGDSDKLEIGEKVLAIGNPFGLGQTLTVGVVSMLGRNIRDNGRVMKNLIQTDASINPGSSGGALVNSKGELVGINTAILSPTGSSIGIGFAIPVNQVKEVTPGLIYTWGKWLAWILALLLVFWILRKIYRR